MIAFKTWSALSQFRDLHPEMRGLLEWVYRSAWPTDVVMVITRIADYDAGQKTAVHTEGPPWRAVDLRISNIPTKDAERVRDAVNAAWRYDPNRPEMRCCVLHDAGSGNHIHLQVHNLTSRTPAPPVTA